MRTIVVGILYKWVEPYLDDYFDSIVNQSTNNFELYLFNNNYVGSAEFSGFLAALDQKGINVKMIDVLQAGTSFAAREFVISTLKNENVDNVIFTDTDDYYDNNRFEMLIDGLKKNDFVFNGLTPFLSDTKEKYSTSSVPVKISFLDNLKKNILGYNNTAVKAKHLHKISPFILDGTPKVTDWPLYQSLLAIGLKAIFIPNTTTYYRQYDQNTAGLRRQFTKEQIKFGISVKINQYTKCLLWVSGEEKESVELELRKIEHLKKELDSEEAMKKYLRQVNKTAEEKIFYWWEYIDLKFLENKL